MLKVMKYTRIRPGRYSGTDGINTADIHRVREGMIGCNGWMWVAKLNGRHITNADTLAAAKAAIGNEMFGYAAGRDRSIARAIKEGI